MKRIIPAFIKTSLLTFLLVASVTGAYASHVIGAQLSYKWVPGPCSNTYQVTLVLYGDCSSTSGAFQTLPAATPMICIFDGATSVSPSLLIPAANPMVLSLPSPQCGSEVTPVCPDSLAYTTCTNVSYPIAGIKKFVCTGTVTLPYRSANWKFVYEADNGSTTSSYSCGGVIGTRTTSPSASGRTAAITNIAGGTSMQLVTTLNNSVNNPRMHNSNPELTVEPTPFYCLGYPDAYNPGAIDLYDTNYLAEPSGDSLVFSLINATSAGGGCGAIGGSVTYLAGYSGANPLALSSPLVFDPTNGQMYFTPSIVQRSVVVYNIAEYINDTVGQMSTIAGIGAAGFAGDSGAAAAAELNRPSGICLDGVGNVYFADCFNNRIRQINSSGVITTIAGTGAAGYAGDGGSAVTARLNHPMGISLNAAGDLFVADMGNNVIRKISGGIISTIAGNGVPGFAGDGGPAAAATCELKSPIAVFADAIGNIYISDTGNERIRKINAAGIISTITGNGFGGLTGDGGLAASAQINQPFGLCVDGAQNVYFADAANNRIREITAGGVITTVAGTTAGFAGDGGKATAAKLNTPTDVKLDKYNYLVIADRDNNVVRLVDTCGYINTIAGNTVPAFAGDGSAPTSASMDSLVFLARDIKQNIFISDYKNNRVRKIVWNAIVNKTQVGSMQREMNFLVEPCTYSTPTGTVDSIAGSGIHRIDATHFYGCANNGNFELYLNPRETDTTMSITVTATGLSPGFTLGVVGNNTNHPHATVTVNTNTVIPGNYTFYLTYTDNHCPLTGTNTIAFNVNILPVPTITDSLISPATCSQKAAYWIQPGGTGKPWTIKFSGPSPSSPLTDTFQVVSLDTAGFIDSLLPGLNIATIFTSVSNQCSVFDSIQVIRDSFHIHGTYIPPTYCGARDGSLKLVGFTPGHFDTLSYIQNGVTYGPIPFPVLPDSSYTITGLPAGIYDSIVGKEGLCLAIDPVADTLNNPLFVFRALTTKGTQLCGYADGGDTIWGLHPMQLDTILYHFRPFFGTVVTPNTFTHVVGSDSTVVTTGLLAGYITDVVISTATDYGVCADSIPGPFIVDTVGIHARFDTAIHYGCHGDTIAFTNLSTPDSGLFYSWSFGDGATSAEPNPTHMYANTNGSSVTIKLYITNTKCVDSFIVNKTFNNYISGGFSFTPSQFVCQDSVVTFTNTSTGTNPTYTWIFGDGTISNATNPTHTYANTGKYNIVLVANENMIPLPSAPDTYTPCFDSVFSTISVDSASVAAISTTDSVICQGEGITFTGNYSSIGLSKVTWTFGDGGVVVDKNPVLHSYDQADTVTATLYVQYRACPSVFTTHKIAVYPFPGIYLGPDLTMCPGSSPINLVDQINENNNSAKWLWNTGETTPGIVVTKPGTYINTVTISGCTATDTVVVLKDCYMDIPNVFTPNGDGTNDFFYPRQELTKGLVSFKMDIYNRWGQLIYETTNTDGRGWDGSFNGQPQPEGVYIYNIDATYKDGQIEHHTGNVTLLR